MASSMREIRKSAGMTQEQLAASVNATKRQIGAWERGENDMPMDYAVMIADVLGCTVDELAGRDNPMAQLARDEREVIDMMREMDAPARRLALKLVRAVWAETA